MDLNLKRVYEQPSSKDGVRILVDRLWPRGLSKEKVKIDHWMKNISPSSELRKWYNHDPKKWNEFKERYFSELNSNIDMLNSLIEVVKNNKSTLVYSSKEEEFNNAVALKEFLVKHLAKNN